jgi:hypothetical protein
MRSQFRILGVLAIAASLVIVSAGDADARRKKRRKKVKKKAKAAKVIKVNEKALSPLKGPFKFGMSPKAVIKKIRQQVREAYADKIRATSDVYQQDKLRKESKDKIQRVVKSYIKFKGQRTGWDVSIIDDQFRHKTGESMLVYWENNQGKDQRRFFFFHNKRLYKMFIQLNTASLGLKRQSFAYFQNVIEKRFGPGKVGFRTDSDGSQFPNRLDWISPRVHAAAIDKLSFYGAFCLMIADSPTQMELAKLRKDRAPPPKKRNAVIKAVVSSGDDDPNIDDNEGAIKDLLKGK